MSQTILIEEDSVLGRMYSLNLNVFAGTDVVIKTNPQDAIDLLKIHPAVDLIICSSTVKNLPAAAEVYGFLAKEGRHIPMIVIGETPALGREVKVISNRPTVTELIGFVVKALGIRPQEVLDRPIPNLFPIPITVLMDVEIAVCDIYLKLKKSDRPDHFIKRFSKDDDISKGALFRYLAYGETEMFVPSADRVHFVQVFTEQIVEKLKNENLDINERIQINESSMELAAESVRTVGMTPETAAVIDASITSIMTTVKQTPSLEALFKNMLSNKSGFIYKHCQICVFICSHIVKRVKWGADTHSVKLGVVSFFHDILLPNEKLARISSDKELAEGNLAADEKILVMKHAQLASELFRKFPSEHLDAEIIIRQHHGSFGGYGFVDKFPINISPLSMVFIVAEDFTMYIMNNFEKGLNKKEAIKRMRAYYKGDRYVQILEALESIEI